MNFNSHKNQYTEQDDRRIIELRKEGKTMIEIAEALNRSSSSIMARLSRINAEKDKSKPWSRFNLVGQKFGELEVIEMVSTRGKGFRAICRCKCGRIVKKEPIYLRKGRSRSCGCNNDHKAKRGRHALFTGYEEISGTIWRKLLDMARVRNLKVELTIEEIWDLFVKQERRCALSGLPIVFGCGQERSTASLDRIDNDRGYLKDNVQWVHKSINMMKQCLDNHLFVNLCQVIVSYQASVPNIEQTILLERLVTSWKRAKRKRLDSSKRYKSEKIKRALIREEREKSEGHIGKTKWTKKICSKN